MHKSQKTILTRFIAKNNMLDSSGNPTLAVFMKRENEAGLSMWDISELIKKNDEKNIFKFGDENYAKNPPHAIARCDLIKENMDSLFAEIAKKMPYINYKIIESDKSPHRDICFNTLNNPALDYHIAQKLINISDFKKRSKNIN